MPPRRPFRTGAVRSRRRVPSDYVPGDVSANYAAVLQRGGEGAGSDCVPLTFTRVLYAKELDLIAVFHFHIVLHVNCTPPLYE
jgi:hypothetical protein